MLPFWTSFLVRTYAWMFLLRDTGLFNTALQALGIIHSPLPLLYNDGAVLLGLVYGYLPFMVLPIYATLERLDPALLEAAADLGARPLATVFRIVVPLSRPGIVAGSVLVFIPCLGAYLTPDLLGGGNTVTGRQPGAESVHDCARLALRLGRLDRPDGAGDPAAGDLPAARKRAPGMKRWLGALRRCVLRVSSSAAVDPGGLQLQLVALHRVGGLFAASGIARSSAIRKLLEGTWNSVVIALWATVLSTIIGTLCAYGLWKRNSRTLTGSLYLSLVTPEIVTGISLLALFQWAFRWLHWQLGLYTVILAHVAFSHRLCGDRRLGATAHA